MKCQVAGLKHQIELATGLPGGKLKLVYKGKTVDQDHIALSESGTYWQLVLLRNVCAVEGHANDPFCRCCVGHGDKRPKACASCT